jgi:hypothetical protein
MPRFTNKDTDDSIDYEIDRDTHSALFTVVKMDRLNQFMDLVSRFQDEVAEDEVEYVLTWFPSQGTHKKFNRETRVYEICDNKMFNKTSQHLEIVDRMDDGSVLVACPLGEFPYFLEKNLTFLVSTGMISCDSLIPQPDDEGFTEVVNVRRIKQNKKRELSNTLNSMSRQV